MPACGLSDCLGKKGMQLCLFAGILGLLCRSLLNGKALLLQCQVLLFRYLLQGESMLIREEALLL